MNNTVTPSADTDPDGRAAPPYYPLPDSPWPVLAAAAARILAGLPPAA